MGWRRIKGLRRLAGKFCRKQDGTAAVEFALVGLPFFWLLAIVFETAAVLFTDIALQNGVTETVRLIRTGQAQTQNISKDQFKARLCQNIASYIDCSSNKLRIEIRKFAVLPTTPSAVPDIMTVPTDAPQVYDIGGPSEWVLVRARYDWNLFVPGLSQLSNFGDGTIRRMTAGAMFRNEPYGG